MSTRHIFPAFALFLALGQQSPAHAACGQYASQWGKPGCPYPSLGPTSPTRPTCHRIRQRGHLVRICDTGGYPGLR